jgi:ketosteroid isomerase-like protein
MLTTTRALLDCFLGAFSRLDLDAMLVCFAPQATAFFPVEHQRTRLDDMAAIAAAFAAVLAQLRTKRATGLPLVAENLIVQEWDDTAVATFHLRGEHLSRRTLVLQRSAGEWRIVHLHASNGSLAD